MRATEGGHAEAARKVRPQKVAKATQQARPERRIWKDAEICSFSIALGTSIERRRTIPVPFHARRSGIVAIALLALAGCGDRKSQDGAAPEKAESGQPVGKIAAARAYVDSFITEDADKCFGTAVLEEPGLEPAEGTLGPQIVPARVIVAIDGSGSMAGRLGGRTKLDLARQAALGFVEGLPAAVEASLLVFGQQGDNQASGKAKSCGGIDVLAPMSTDRARLTSAVRQVRSVGWTPLAAGLERAQALLAPSAKPGEQVIYVVSDGEETCGGDPVAVARRINGGNTRAIVNVIGFGLPSGEAAALKSVADAGGGRFVNVSTDADFDRTIDMVRTANRQARNAIKVSDADTRNALRTSDVADHAAKCVSDIADNETKRMGDDLEQRSKQGVYPPFATEALRLQNERHRALLDRSSAFTKRLLSRSSDAHARMKVAEKESR